MSSTPEGQGEFELKLDVDNILNTHSNRSRIRMAAYVISDQVAVYDYRQHEMHDKLFKQEPTVLPPSTNFHFSLRGFGITNQSFLMLQSVIKPEHDATPHDELNGTSDSISDFDKAHAAFERAELVLRASMDGAQAVYNLSDRQIEKAKRLSRKLS